ncbi:TAXI family TRAP transporter solute-binding subunit [Marinobacter adhaerens]|uniref:TAXI family TRAP transporter solute-binding subunit n=1 Tax=Marinobacter adhaerens TaxID=1033846 RepID=A0A851HW35_9GAMM|nr:TAXI family TRAP transporter solute-binding subunit [Marinobacter adhaerens]NWN91796.1 TAXI family TRAP transporter solute-binding subunit [Marinobacter adhaerens]
MRQSRLFISMALSGTVAIGSAGLAQADDGDLPRLLVVGTPSAQTGSFASTNGWAAIFQDQTSSAARIVPEDSETQRYKRLTERRDITMSSVSVAEMQYQIEGRDSYAATKPVAQRIIWHHNDTPWGWVVSGDSDIQTVEDLKRGDVKLAQGVFSPVMTRTARKSMPAYLGVSPEKADEIFEYVPASSYVENCRSVVEGKADAAWCSPISSVLSEMEGAPGGIRWLSMDTENKDAWERLLDHSPMTIPTTFTFGVSSAIGVDGVTSTFVYSAPADVSDDFAYAMAKWFHQSYDDYKKTHGLATRMQLDVFKSFVKSSPLPLHEGTVRYLKEIGAWSDEEEAFNQEAIAQVDGWIEARKKAMDEARDKRIVPDPDNKEFMAILERHTEGLETFRSRL